MSLARGSHSKHGWLSCLNASQSGLFPSYSPCSAVSCFVLMISITSRNCSNYDSVWCSSILDKLGDMLLRMPKSKQGCYAAAKVDSWFTDGRWSPIRIRKTSWTSWYEDTALDSIPHLGHIPFLVFLYRINQLHSNWHLSSHARIHGSTCKYVRMLSCCEQVGTQGVEEKSWWGRRGAGEECWSSWWLMMVITNDYANVFFLNPSGPTENVFLLRETAHHIMFFVPINHCQRLPDHE